MLSVGHVAACGLESDWSKVPHCRESRVVMVEQGLGRRVAVVLMVETNQYKTPYDENPKAQMM